MLIPVVLSGGPGTSVSGSFRASSIRNSLLPLVGKGNDVAGKLLARVGGDHGYRRALSWCVTNSICFLGRGAMRKVNLDATAIILEPVERKYAPAVPWPAALAALYCKSRPANDRYCWYCRPIT